MRTSTMSRAPREISSKDDTSLPVCPAEPSAAYNLHPPFIQPQICPIISNLFCGEWESSPIGPIHCGSSEVNILDCRCHQSTTRCMTISRLSGVVHWFTSLREIMNAVKVTPFPNDKNACQVTLLADKVLLSMRIMIHWTCFSLF